MELEALSVLGCGEGAGCGALVELLEAEAVVAGTAGTSWRGQRTVWVVANVAVLSRSSRLTRVNVAAAG